MQGKNVERNCEYDKRKKSLKIPKG